MTTESLRTRAETPSAALPRLSHSTGFWTVSASLAVLIAFSAAPSPLYGVSAREEHLSSTTVTAVYAIYAAGVVASLLLVGHVSDWYGRRVWSSSRLCSWAPLSLCVVVAAGVLLATPVLLRLLSASPRLT